MCGFLIAALISSGILTSQIAEMLAGKVEPCFFVSCEDTQENRLQVIDEVANLYGYFLSYEAHRAENCVKLRTKGMWLEIKTEDDYFPSSESVSAFVQNLKQLMEEDLARERPWGASTRLGVDYGPDLGVLAEAFRKTELNILCNLLLPYKSVISIELKKDQIWTNIWLRGPLF